MDVRFWWEQQMWKFSELLSKMLSIRKIKHNVLNAKQHQREADIVAEAGQPGTVYNRYKHGRVVERTSSWAKV